MKNNPVLYSFRRCPYAIRARMALAYSNVEVELRELKLSDVPVEMLDISPKGTVPVLQLADGTVLQESLGIIDWALDCYDPDNWKGLADDDLIHENDQVFKPLLDRYKYADRYPQMTQHEHRTLCFSFLSNLEQRLQNTEFLSAKRLGKTDIAIMPFVRQFAGVEPDWFADCEFPRLRHWLDSLLGFDLFKQTMKKYPVWQRGEEPVYF